jgi:hypothetical protein
MLPSTRVESTNKASVMRTLAKDLRLAKFADAESAYEQMKSRYDKKIYLGIDGLKNVVRIVRKLEKEGLF